MKRILSVFTAALLVISGLRIGGVKVEPKAEAKSAYAEEDLAKLNCAVIKDDSRREYVNKMIRFHLSERADSRIRSALDAGRAVVFFFDGASDNVDDAVYGDYTKYRFSAVCAVVKLKDGAPEIVFSDDCSSTTPDNPRKPELNEGTPVPTVVDGVYRLVTCNHYDSYAALHLVCYQSGDVLRCTQDGSYTSESYGIDVHARWSNEVTPTSQSSEGCLLVGKRPGSSVRYDQFMKAVAGISQAYASKFSSVGQEVGVAVIDHTLYREQIMGLYGDDRNHTAKQIADILTAYTRGLDPDEPSGTDDPVGADPDFAEVLPFVFMFRQDERVQGYTAPDMRKKGALLSADAEYSVEQVYENGACRVVGEADGEQIEAFVPLEEIFFEPELPGGWFPVATAKKQITTYVSSDGEEYGYIDAADVFWFAGSKDGRTQVLYPISGGYKLGWADDDQLPARTYRVRFDAGEGTGAPAAQYKEEGKPLTLTGKTPNRKGYRFEHWVTVQDGGGKIFLPGETYEEDENVTLYAVWTESDEPEESGSESASESAEPSSETESETGSGTPESEEGSGNTPEKSADPSGDASAAEPGERDGSALPWILGGAALTAVCAVLAVIFRRKKR